MIEYPKYEELTFKANIQSEEEGYELLTAIQVIVNSLGAKGIIDLYGVLRKNPNILNYLPLLK